MLSLVNNLFYSPPSVSVKEGWLPDSSEYGTYYSTVNFTPSDCYSKENDEDDVIIVGDESTNQNSLVLPKDDELVKKLVPKPLGYQFAYVGVRFAVWNSGRSLDDTPNAQGILKVKIYPYHLLSQSESEEDKWGLTRLYIRSEDIRATLHYRLIVPLENRCYSPYKTYLEVGKVAFSAALVFIAIRCSWNGPRNPNLKDGVIARSSQRNRAIKVGLVVASVALFSLSARSFLKWMMLPPLTLKELFPKDVELHTSNSKSDRVDFKGYVLLQVPYFRTVNRGGYTRETNSSVLNNLKHTEITPRMFYLP